MSLKWLPNALTILRCVLAFVVGWAILDISEGAFSALTLDSVVAHSAPLGRPYEVEMADIQFRSKSVYWPLLLPFCAFVLAALTDLLDGFLARKLNATSRFGTLLDPIADKLLVGITLLAFCAMQKWQLLFVMPSFAIIARDIAVSMMRVRAPQGIQVSLLAKWKTAVEMLALTLFLANCAIWAVAEGPTVVDIVIWSSQIALILLYIAAALSLYTGYQYARAAFAPDTKL